MRGANACVGTTESVFVWRTRSSERDRGSVAIAAVIIKPYEYYLKILVVEMPGLG